MRVVRAGAAHVSVVAFRVPADNLRVVAGQTLDAAKWRREKKARVAINGGYFDENGHSMGLRIVSGRSFSSLRKADWGVLWTRGNRAHIVHTRDWNPKTRADQAIQCGPRLVVNGKTTDLKNQYGRRTGVGIDRTGRILVAVADGNLSLPEWAAVWAARDGLNCRDALNLDGGPSSQLSLKTASKTAEIAGGWPVPDALTIQ